MRIAQGVVDVPSDTASVDWWDAVLREAWADLTPLLLLALIAAAAVRQQPNLPPDRRRLRGTSVMLLLHVASLPLLGALAAHGASAYPDVRLVSLALATFAGINLALILIFDGALHWLKLGVPRLLLDICAFLAYAIASVMLLSRRGVNLSGLIATSAVLTAVIGLSLQDTLGNLIGGMALQLEKSVRVGDWITVGEYTGRVSQIRWRQTSLETRNWETVIVPNGQLLKSQIVVLGRRTGEPVQWRRWVHFNVDFRFNPNDVIAACEDALRKAPIPGAAATPPPNCILLDMRDSYHHYAVRYWLTDLAADDPTDSVVRTRIYFALKRAGIPQSIPAQAVFVTSETEDRRERKAELDIEHRRTALRAVELFDSLDDDEIEQLAVGLAYAPFAAGETMTRQGSEGHHLYLVVRGKVSVRVSVNGREQQVATLDSGAFLGERSLMTGEPRSATTVAVTDVVCYRLDKEVFEQVLRRRPALAEQCAEVLARRESELFSVRQDLDQRTRAAMLAEGKRDMVAKIRTFFGL